MEKTTPCRVCHHPVIVGQLPNWRDCCSQECARVLMMLTGMASLSANLCVLIEATNPSDYSASGAEVAGFVTAWLES